MPKTLPPDATIATVWPHLTHQRDYVRGVLQAMRRCNAKHLNSSVRIGVTGTGQKPYYRISYAPQDGGGELEIFDSFYDNHDPFESGFAATNNWSSRSMTFTEVQDFFADAIGWKGRKV